MLLLPIELSDEERAQLEAWTRRRTSAQALAQRSRIVLAGRRGAQEHRDRRAARDQPGDGRASGASRFAEHRLDGLTDEPRPGRPRTITDEQVDAVITTTLESTPKDATHWSTRSMAAEVGLTQTAVSRIWRAFGLQPHRQDTFKLSKDPLFVDKVHDVVGLYLNPPERAVVLCVDEKSQIQALDRTAPILPMLPGIAAARHARLQARRHLQPLRRAGPHHRQGHRRAAQPPPRDRVQAVPHRPSTARSPPTSTSTSCSTTARPTRRPRSRRWLLAHPRFQLHFTPTSSSWLNLVERWFGRAHHQAAQARHAPLRPRPQHRHPRLDRDLERRPRPYVWTKTADQILDSIRRYCDRINDSRH